MVIDFHTHVYPEKIADKAMKALLEAAPFEKTTKKTNWRRKTVKKDVKSGESIKKLEERRKALDEYLSEMYGDDVVHFDGPEFDDGIIGVSSDDCLVYSYSKLVEALMKHNGWEETDAIEWLDFNTIRSIPYIHGKAPIIVYDLDIDML